MGLSLHRSFRIGTFQPHPPSGAFSLEGRRDGWIEGGIEGSTPACKGSMVSGIPSGTSGKFSGIPSGTSGKDSESKEVEN